MSSKMDWTRRFLAAALAALLALAAGFSQADETITYIHWDAQGSPVAATDQDGNVVWRESYRPYGERSDNDPAASPHTRWYTGHPQDEDTGLIYAGARYYDPVIGRFLGPDPVSFQEDNLHSFNRYAYGNNNPYRYVDPDGRESTDIGCLGDGCFADALQNRSAVDTVSNVVYESVGTATGIGPLFRAGKLVYKAGKSALGMRRATRAEKWNPAQFERHHTIPREIEKRLPPEVRNHPNVRGRKGLPNRKDVPYKKHREIHRGTGGGRYNQRFDEEIARRGGYENVDPADITNIRDDLVDEFGL